MYARTFILLSLVSFLALPLVSEASLVASKKQLNKTNDTTAPMASSLVGYWPFDGGDMGPGYALDRSGQGFTATTTNVKSVPGKIGQAMGFNLEGVQPLNGLVGWWNMDSNRIMGTAVTDLSASGNTLTLSSNGTAITSVGGQIGQALSFPGGTNVAYATNAAPSNLKNQDFTISFWIFPNTQNTDIKTPLDYDHSSTPQGFAVQSEDATTNKNYYMTYYDGTGYRPTIGTGQGVPYTSSVWQHIVYTKSGTTVIGYKNGVSAWTPTNSGVATVSYASSPTFAIGDAVNPSLSNIRAFNGYIDDVRIYNRALSATEVATLYKGSSYAQISPTATLNTFSSGISIGTWVRYASSTGTQILMRKSDSVAGTNSYELLSNGTNFQLQIGAGTPTTVTGTTAIVPNVWYHVIGTADGSTMRLYVNGVQEGSASVSGTISTGSSNNWAQSFFLGMDDTPNNYFVGYLDEPRIYNRALTANEVRVVYQQGTRTTTTNKPLVTNLDSSPGLSGWWTFDGGKVYGTTVLGTSTAAVAGVLNGGVQTTTGKLGQSLTFGGVSTDYVSMGNVFNDDSSYTVSAWVRPTSIGHTNYDEIISKGGTDSDFDLLINTSNSNTFGFYLCAGAVPAGCKNVQSVSTAKLNTWQLVTALWDKAAGNLDIYVNGVFENRTTGVTGTRATNATNFCLGQHCAGGGFANRYFAGNMDDVRVYNRALSSVEIQKLYSLGGTKIQTNTDLTHKTSPGLASGLVGWWTLDGKDCGLAYCLDKSGGGNVSTLTATRPTPGKIGQALLFNGTSSLVTATVAGTQAVTYWYRTPSGSWTFNASSTNTTYVNGVTAALTQNPVLVEGSTIQIGNTGSVASPTYFSGAIDDVRIYSRALSANEVRQLYRLGQ